MKSALNQLIDDYEIYCCEKIARGCVGDVPKAELAAVGVPVFDNDEYRYAIAYGSVIALKKNVHGVYVHVAELHSHTNVWFAVNHGYPYPDYNDSMSPNVKENEKSEIRYPPKEFYLEVLGVIEQCIEDAKTPKRLQVLQNAKEYYLSCLEGKRDIQYPSNCNL